MKVVCIIGMAGAGKSEVARLFERQGFGRVGSGDATDEEVARRGLALNGENQPSVRELLRREHLCSPHQIIYLFPQPFPLLKWGPGHGLHDHSRSSE